MRENRPYGSEGGEQRYCSPTPIGFCAHGAPLLAWIPAYAGTTTCLSLATFKAPVSSRVFASIVASVILPRTVVGVGRSPGQERSAQTRACLNYDLRRSDERACLSFIQFSGTCSSAPRGFDRSDVDFLHLHHRFECSLCSSTIGIGRCFHENARRDLPGQTPLVLAPSAHALGATVADDRIPITVGLFLSFGEDLKREGFAVFECRAAVQAEARHAHDRELDGEHLPLFAGRKVAGRPMNGCHGAVRERPGIEVGRFFRGVVIPKANDVLGHRLFSIAWIE